jgi:hypothetical protein
MIGSCLEEEEKDEAAANNFQLPVTTLMLPIRPRLMCWPRGLSTLSRRHNNCLSRPIRKDFPFQVGNNPTIFSSLL